MPDALKIAKQWLGEGRGVAIATVIETWNSAPIGVGGQLVVDDRGRFAGSVSGGCVEAEVIAQSAEVIASGAPRVLEFGVSDETAWTVGLPCGGSIKILLNRFEAAGEELLDAILEARGSRTPITVETRLADGAQKVVAGPRPHTEAAAARAESISTGNSGIVQTDAGAAFLHAFMPAPRLIAVGATHIAQVLVRLAGEAGFDVIVVDPRAAFANAARFAGTALDVRWPDDALPEIGLDARTAVVTLAHQEDIDDRALIAALAGPAFYVGALGSRRTHAKRVARLEARGVPSALIAAIHAPAGLAIGAATPPEIALSIMAEIVAELRKS